MILRCVSFTSVSSDEQAEEGKVSLTEQRAWTRHFVASTIPQRYGYEAREVEHLQIVGSRKILLLNEAIEIHPAYARLYEMIVGREFDVLVAMKMNRVAREEALSITIRDLCLAYGIAPAWGDGLPPTLNVDELRRDEGWRISGMVQAWGAGREVRELGDKVRSGRRARVTEKRQFIGSPPYGYMAIRDENDERVAMLHPEQAPIVRRIFVDWYLRLGWGADRIVEELNELAVPAPSGGQWTRSGMQTLLARARIYTGQLAYGRFLDASTEWFEGAHPAILTTEEYAAIEREMERRSPGRPRVYAWSGFVWCVSCGRRMNYNRQVKRRADGRRVEYDTLRCRGCEMSIPVDRIIAALRAGLEVLTAADLSSMAVADDREEQFRAEVARLERELAEAEAAVARLLDAYEVGQIPLSLLSERIEARRQRVATLTTSLARAERQLREYLAGGDAEARASEIQRAGLTILDMADEDPSLVRRWLTEYVIVQVYSREEIVVLPRLYG